MASSGGRRQTEQSGEKNNLDYALKPLEYFLYCVLVPQKKIKEFT